MDRGETALARASPHPGSLNRQPDQARLVKLFLCSQALFGVSKPGVFNVQNFPTNPITTMSTVRARRARA